MDYKDYYATLGISADADEQAIKTAFRKLARVHHPDVAVEKIGATERFKEINEAYTVLSDPDKRRTYDLFRTRYERYQTTYRVPRPEPARPASASATSAKPRTTGATSGATSAGRASGAARCNLRRRGLRADCRSRFLAGSGPLAGRDFGRSTARSAQGGASSDRSGPRRTNTRTVSEEDFERLFRGFMWAYTATASRNSGRSGSTASSDFSDFFEFSVRKPSE